MKVFVQNILRKQLKDIKIILILLHLRKWFPTIEIPICNSAKCKMKFIGHWLQYSTKPNVTTLTNNYFAFIFFAETWPGHCLCSDSYHKLVFTPLLQSLHLITRKCCLQICSDKAYMGQYGNKSAVKHWQQSHTNEWEPAMILETVMKKVNKQCLLDTPQHRKSQW